MGPRPQWRTLAAVSMLRVVLTMRLELKDGQMSNRSLILDKYPGVSGVTSEVKVLRVEKNGKGWKRVESV